MENIFCLNKDSIRGHTIWKKNQTFRKQLWKKPRACLDFKDSFAWLTGMNKQFCWYFNIFGSGHFLTIFLRYHGSKNDRSKNIHFKEKSLFSCLLTSQKNVCHVHATSNLMHPEIREKWIHSIVHALSVHFFKVYFHVFLIFLVNLISL